MRTLPHRRTVNLLHGERFGVSAFADKSHCAGAGFGRVHVNAFINITVGMTGNGNGLFPVFNNGMNGIDEYRCAENRSVEN